MNLADDYFDYKHDSRTRADISSTSVRARMEKCHYLGEGKATVSQLGWAMVGFLGFAALMGGIAFAAQWILHGWQAAMGIIIYAVLGLIVGINYSGKPLELGFHGLGELVIGLMFGPLLMLGVQAALTGMPFSWPMLCMSVAIGCMVTNIVYVHSVMEVNADAELGKMTFARLLLKAVKRLNGEAVMIMFVGVFAMLPFVLLGVGIALGWWSPWYLLTLLTLPMSVYLIHSTRLFAYGLPREDTPHWWMGPMGDWEKYKAAGIDWFLYRWLLARNICTFFCLIVIIVQLVVGR
jgi:1,4-dihydroxy-2-naphthoate octaprenyltransferase